MFWHPLHGWLLALERRALAIRKRWLEEVIGGHLFTILAIATPVIGSFFVGSNNAHAQAPSGGAPEPPQQNGNDWTDRDAFLGRISMAFARDAFQESVDPFSGYLHANLVYVRLPGKGGYV